MASRKMSPPPSKRPVASAPPGSVAAGVFRSWLSDAILKSVKDVGYEEPTPIQIKTIPVMLPVSDMIAQAQTGSGKTAAFGLPIIDAIDPWRPPVQALIWRPTRELAIQVAEALHRYGRHKSRDAADLRRPAV